MEKEDGRDYEISLIVEAIKRVGPRNCSLISRLTGIPVETVRYKIRRQLIRKGIRVQLSVNYNKLGLVRNWVTLDFNDEYSDLAPNMLDVLSKIGYLTYYGRIVPQGNYASIIAFPIEAKAEYRSFMKGLIDLGILSSYQLDELAYIGYLSMRPEYYDFNTRTWNIDWETLARSKAIVKETEKEYVYETTADKIDVLLLKELQIDSTASLTKIARKLGIEPNTVRYHYMEHILRGRLITNYFIRWQAALGKDERYSTLAMVVHFRNLTREELSIAQEALRALPFTWFDALSNDRSLYLVYITLPITLYVKVLDYLRRKVSKHGMNFWVSLIDPSCSMGYTIPYEMFDGERGWIFNAERTLEKLGSAVALLKGIKSGLTEK